MKLSVVSMTASNLPLRLTDFELTWTDGGRPPADANWIPAAVPGGVHEALVAAGLIGHPYDGDNEHSLGWVETATWWYRSRFDGVDGEQTRLRFDGLDTVAEIWLNDQRVGTARNQHRPHELQVTLAARNELLVAFPPPLQAVQGESGITDEMAAIRARQQTVRPNDEPLPDAELLMRAARPRLRKATFSWGWDFAARVPSCGISGAVIVGPVDDLLADLRVRSLDVDVAARTCVLQVTGALREVSPATRVSVEVRSPSGDVATGDASIEGTEVHLEVALRDVDLWWTHDLGSPSLYDVTVTVEVDGRIAERRTVRHGIRTIVLDRSPDKTEDAQLFRFLLNGHPTFARGANWVPPSLLVASIPDETVRELVRLARDGGMTMIRVWGGGVYPTDVFYDACDELGVLVWQDFMFACYDYPDPTGALAEETALEAAHQVRQLRHHPSLALWCGENEVQAIHQLVHGETLPRGRGWELFNEVLPAVVAEHDPDTTYWPGSPWGDRPGEIVNSTNDGDRHAWEVWHGIDIGAGTPKEYASRGEAMHFTRYENDRGRFISEFGIHASPELATLRRWSGSGPLEVRSAALEQRIKDTPKDKGFALMSYETGEPSTITEYVDFTMACQAEGLKHGVEHYRRRQPHCAGTLVWQLNDSWPGVSWSVIDYELTPKAGYYFLQRALQPVLASFAVDGDGLVLWVSNSGREAVPLQLRIELGGFDRPDWDHYDVEVVAQPYSSTAVWRQPGQPRATDIAWVSEAGGLFPTNRRFFDRLKNLPVRSGKVAATLLGRSDDRAQIRLDASGYCYFTRLQSNEPGVRFSANYLDLRDGESCDIEVIGLSTDAAISVGTYCSPPDSVN